jgi:hypothetical protein
MDRKALEAFPADLLDGSRETLRMAERIVRQLGFGDFEHLPPTPLSQRLSWAIMAIEDGESMEQDPPDPVG